MGTECPDAVGVRVYCVNSSSGDVLSQHFEEKSGFLLSLLELPPMSLLKLVWVCGANEEEADCVVFFSS